MDTIEPTIGCKSYIQCQFLESLHLKSFGPRPFITISRQAGAGGITIGNLLGEYLREHDECITCECPWTVFDRNLVHRVVEDHELSEKIMEYMSEDNASEISDTLEDLFGLHPSRWILVHKTAATILRLAEMGHVILVGRGANVITAGLPGGFHVRLIGSVRKRVEHLQEYYGLPAAEASVFLKREDKGRKQYLKKYFGKDIEDPLLYHLVIDTDRLSYEETAKIIGDAVLQQPVYAAAG